MAGEKNKASGTQGHQKGSQGHRSGGQGHSQGHLGHDHHDRRTERKTAKQRPTSSTKRGRNPTHAVVQHEEEPPRQEVTESSSTTSLDDDDDRILETDAEERVYMTRDSEEIDRNQNRGADDDDGKRNGQELPSPPLTPPLPKRLNRDNYDIRSFNASLGEFVGVLSDRRFQEMSDDYPVDDLLSVVSMVSATIEEYKEHTVHTQKQLEALRNTMRTVKENIHITVTRQAWDLRQDEAQTIEEKELKARLTRLNSTVAEAHAEVAEANKLSAETESAAAQAQLAATMARKEAERIEEEIALKAELERKKKEQEEKKREEEERKKHEEQRKMEEEQRAKERAWKEKQEATHQQSKKGRAWEDWPTYDYETKGREEEREILCCVRAHPAHFDKGRATVDVIEQTDVLVTYAPHEELISNIIEMKSTEDKEFPSEEPMIIAIPHMLTRMAALSREAFVKTLEEGRWVELTTKEVTFEHYKDQKFAQVETKHPFSKFVVMSRFKRDYLTFNNRSSKATSSYDQRIVLTVSRDTFKQNEYLLLQIQPIDSASVNEFRARDPNGKALLTSSPIVHMEWQTKETFSKPVNVSLPCPPNPAKAKKMAMLRKQKEEKMKGNKPVVPLPVDKDKEKEKLQRPSKLKQAQVEAAQPEGGEESAPPVTARQNKWYMGQYGQTDEDENDQLCFVGFSYGRWQYIPDVKIVQVKLDLVNFNLDFAWDRFMVLRTRPGPDEITLLNISKGINDQLSKRWVHIVVKQRFDDPSDVCLHVTPVSRLERVLQQLAEEGYENGPDPSHVVSVYEGDTIAVRFHGNVRMAEEDETKQCTLRLMYNSNMSTSASFTVCEVDKYLQKNFATYRGLLLFERRYLMAPPAGKKRAQQQEEPEVKSEELCDLTLKIPKYHTDTAPTPIRAPINLRSNLSMDQSLLQEIAAGLGDEWRRLASRLQVQHVRVQAILRVVQGGPDSEEQAKYEMLMTWLKRSPQAADKTAILANALTYVGRYDLADMVRPGVDLEQKRSRRSTRS